jgi:hypothetical protein
MNIDDIVKSFGTGHLRGAEELHIIAAGVTVCTRSRCLFCLVVSRTDLPFKKQHEAALPGAVYAPVVSSRTAWKMLLSPYYGYINNFI